MALMCSPPTLPPVWAAGMCCWELVDLSLVHLLQLLAGAQACPTPSTLLRLTHGSAADPDLWDSAVGDGAHWLAVPNEAEAKLEKDPEDMR